MKIKCLVLFAFFPLLAFAQKPDSLLFPGAVKPEEINDAATGDFIHGKGVPVDTIDVGDARFLVILKDDGTWKYIRNLDKLAEDAMFKEYWSINVVNPYTNVELTSIPYRNTIILQDSISRFTSPYVGPRSSGFGWRWRRRHQGVDLPLHTGDPVYAAFDGRVRVSMPCSGYGQLVVIRHPNGLETYYGHLSERKVEAGQWVHSGDVIGLGGSTGRSTGPHLHFETRYQGFAFDPEWIADYSKGELRGNIFVLKRIYLDASSTYVPTSDEEEYEINEADLEEEARIAAEKAKIAAEKAKAQAERNAAKWHTVKKGETLSQIASKYHTTVRQISKLNPKLNPNRIVVGQKIRVR